MYDGSLNCQQRNGGQRVNAPREYSVELVSPVLLYREDIDTLQGLVRRLRKAGGGSPTHPAASTSTWTAPTARPGASATL